jgi:4,5-DOPA dioxygenase extradiol
MPRPRGVVVMTPHFASRSVKLGPTGRGFAMFNMPRFLKRRIPEELDYPSPPSDALATRVEALLAGAHPVERTTDRRGFDHTTWIPLHHLLPAAEAPVVEVSYPFLRDAELVAFGRRLAPLRSEGVLFLASGGSTHNLAAMDFEGTHPVPPWSSEFDAWLEQALAAHEVDALIDWRKKAPAAELAHPDDGAHYRVLLVALGVALGTANTAPLARYPLTGFEAGLSLRCIELS